MFERAREVTIVIADMQVWSEYAQGPLQEGGPRGFKVREWFYSVHRDANIEPWSDHECIGTFTRGEFRVTVNARKSLFVTQEFAMEIAGRYVKGEL